MLVHFVSLIVQTWQSFVASLGNTTLGFFLPTAVVPLAGFILALAVILKIEGKAALVTHLKKTLGWAALVGVAGELFVYGFVLGWTFIRTVCSARFHLIWLRAKQLRTSFTLRSRSFGLKSTCQAK